MMRLMVFAVALVLAAPIVAQESTTYELRGNSQPIAWMPLPKAVAEAERLHRPLLIQLGAEWCPWCALTDQQSYSNPEIAAFINQHFVSVRIDYDANPRLRTQFEKAVAVSNFPVGLPLTLFADAQGHLYWAFTYLPGHPQHGGKSFRDGLEEALREIASAQSRDKNTLYPLNLKEKK